jgi:hypothetical protein
MRVLKLFQQQFLPISSVYSSPDLEIVFVHEICMMLLVGRIIPFRLDGIIVDNQLERTRLYVLIQKACFSASSSQFGRVDYFEDFKSIEQTGTFSRA